MIGWFRVELCQTLGSWCKMENENIASFLRILTFCQIYQKQAGNLAKSLFWKKQIVIYFRMKQNRERSLKKALFLFWQKIILCHFRELFGDKKWFSCIFKKCRKYAFGRYKICGVFLQRWYTFWIFFICVFHPKPCILVIEGRSCQK